ncbi:tripartite tricarboxylate transporter TctB family protein (plasmid) [Paracoccus sp. TD-10]|uniref:tripartite tricarboxylate transporter TctB family protein n=1 Tax=Paracoccus sp. TD-10 TaxID=3395918 RepID=UPI003AAA820F
MKLDKLDLCFAVLIGVLGLFIVATAFGRYGVLSSEITGPGFFPLLSGLLILGGLIGVLADRRRGARLEGSLTRTEVMPVLAISIATVIFLLLMERIGMLVLTPFYIFAVACVIKPPRSARTAIGHVVTAAGFTLFAWVLFDVTLGVPLPEGLLAGAN